MRKPFRTSVRSKYCTNLEIKNHHAGNLKKWWKPETRRKFLSRAQCIIDQYGSYVSHEAGGINLNGVANQGENIADNGAVKEAYMAYSELDLLVP